MFMKKLIKYSEALRKIIKELIFYEHRNAPASSGIETLSKEAIFLPLES